MSSITSLTADQNITHRSLSDDEVQRLAVSRGVEHRPVVQGARVVHLNRIAYGITKTWRVKATREKGEIGEDEIHRGQKMQQS